MKGRKVGQIEVSIEEINTIVCMTNDGAFRTDIARELNRSTHTVWRYQKKFCE
jgi:DNA invertase Pin-like site-specific DNA recombinase